MTSPSMAPEPRLLFLTSKEFHIGYDETLLQPMLDGAKLVISHLDAGTVPDKPEAARKSGMCKMCPFKDGCWS